MPPTSAPGTADGFEQFAAAQARALLGLAHALTANPHDAWDLTQETLVRIAERWDRMHFEEPAAYARTVMVRLNIDRIRRLQARDPAADARRRVDTRRGGRRAGRLAGRRARTLTPRQRTALALRYVEDLDVRTIADRMHCSEGTVKSQLSRGLQRLREHARDHGPLRTTSGEA